MPVKSGNTSCEHTWLTHVTLWLRLATQAANVHGGPFSYPPPPPLIRLTDYLKYKSSYTHKYSFNERVVTHTWFLAGQCCRFVNKYCIVFLATKNFVTETVRDIWLLLVLRTLRSSLRLWMIWPWSESLDNILATKLTEETGSLDHIDASQEPHDHHTTGVK